MMQMLHRGGMDVVTDELRIADDDNPLGYFELERIKKLKQDASWLAETRGKAIKAVSQLLYDLPTSENYRIVWMHRDLDEVLASQEKMLKAAWAGRACRLKNCVMVSNDTCGKSRIGLRSRPNMTTLQVEYAHARCLALEEAQRINAFLGGGLDLAAMCSGAVEPALYRNRKDA